MQVFSQNRGEISQILDHEVRAIALNGKEVQKMHLMIEWSNVRAENTSERFTWERLTIIYRDVPQMVSEYFAKERLDLKLILDKETNKWNRNHGRPGATSKGKSS